MALNSSNITYKGSCFCGALSYAVTGKPILSAYCHCSMCQRLTGCPFVHTIHFPGSSFKWTHAPPHESVMDTFSWPERPWKTRCRCKNCGSNVSSYNSKADKWSVWGVQLERDAQGKIKGWSELQPTAHIFYETRVLDINDNVGKWVGYENQSSRIE